MEKLFWSISKKWQSNIRKYYKNCYRSRKWLHNWLISADLSKQQALDTDPKAIQQFNFTANLDKAGNTRLYFILEEAKETVFKFSQGTISVL